MGTRFDTIVFFTVLILLLSWRVFADQAF